MRAYLATAAIFILLPSAGYSQELWQNTQAGMSKSEIKMLYPEARETVSGSLAGTSIDIFNEKFDVDFKFKNDHLAQVHLSTPMDVLKEPLVTFGLMRDEMIKKYGRPVNDRANSLGPMETIDFISNGTSIELVYFDIGTTFISVTYKPSAGGDPPL
jgi:hypothetical protein